MLHGIRICGIRYGVRPLLETPEGVEVTQRVRDGKRFTFVLNHNEHAVTLALDHGGRAELLTGQRLLGNIPLEGRGVWILWIDLEGPAQDFAGLIFSDPTMDSASPRVQA